MKQHERPLPSRVASFQFSRRIDRGLYCSGLLPHLQELDLVQHRAPLAATKPDAGAVLPIPFALTLPRCGRAPERPVGEKSPNRTERCVRLGVPRGPLSVPQDRLRRDVELLRMYR